MPNYAIGPEKEAEFIQMFYDVVPVPEMVKYFGCDRPTIRATAKRLGLPRRPSGPPVPPLLPEDLDALLRLWDEGATVAHLCRTFGRDRGVMKRLLRINNRDVPTYALGARGPDHPSWGGGRSRDARGYMTILLMPDDPMIGMADKRGRLPEHRLLKALEIGRPLERHEEVHHINGVRDDNRLENLQLRSFAHGAGVVHQCIDCGSSNIRSIPLAESDE